MIKVLYRQKHGFNVAIYSDDHEPAHVHVTRERMHVVVYLDPVEFGQNNGFGRADLRRIRKLISKHEDKLLEVWIAYHGIPSNEGY
ncbi:MAG: DUF4160 domain-containing protein [Chloroflexi bacterium]|nr:DUF4160 domain-containing protein [Chloroflexota bacterium]MXX84754.1 DUF4160 domain-containing protein [Chloroflexota bacterium]MYA92298.1 DUF4160 domain-containing protein [Chloroflexota bacterium]MYC54826.1 DUF4160 domain-containing protein [Chloroflexota bacterium]MYD38079.1 DUF4160 domain-containing protein [Chloroflexota bacterium]